MNLGPTIGLLDVFPVVLVAPEHRWAPFSFAESRPSGRNGTERERENLGNQITFGGAPTPIITETGSLVGTFGGAPTPNIFRNWLVEAKSGGRH